MARDRRDRDPRRAGAVKRAKIGKQMGRGLDKVCGRRKIEPRAWPPTLERAAEIERGFVLRSASGSESKRSLGRIMRRQLPGRVRGGARGARRVDPRTEHGFDGFPGYCPRPQQLGPTCETRDDRRLEAMAAWASVDDPIDPTGEIGGDVSGGRRAHGARSVCRRRREGDASRLD